MADVGKAVIPALLIPLLLIISISVYVKTTDSTGFAFEVAKTDEDTGEDAAGEEVEATPLYDCKYGSVTAVTNSTDTLTVSTDYNVTYNPFGECTITVGAGVPSGSILATYTAYTGDGYTAFEKMNTQTFTGFKLGSLLPFVVISMVVLALVITGVALR